MKRCDKCGTTSRLTNGRCRTCHNRLCNVGNKARRDRYKKAVIEHYSHGTNKCATCSEERWVCLTLDHVNNDGKDHRMKVGRQGVYRDIVERGFPAGFQVLCYNCNIARREDKWKIRP